MASRGGLALDWRDLALAFSALAGFEGADAFLSSRRSSRAMRSLRTQRNTSVVSPMMSACLKRCGSLVSGQMARAMTSIWGENAGSWRVMAVSPCRNALRLEKDLPTAVRGPRLFRPFLLFASVCFCELIWAPPPTERAGVQLPQPHPKWR